MKKLALISVSDKQGIAEFARGLIDCGFEILTTGGTAELFDTSGVPYTTVEVYTGQPELFGGRVKTLHPRLLGGILQDQDNQQHRNDAARHDIGAISLVCVNFYPFAEKTRSGGLNLAQAIAYVDIGGPTMLRAASKNWQHCIPLCQPDVYQDVLKLLKNGDLGEGYRQRLAAQAFAYTSAYEAEISNYFAKATCADPIPMAARLALHRDVALRYGENPTQAAGLYGISHGEPGFIDATTVQGGALSFNNYLDLDSACSLAQDLLPALGAVIVKHTNPCGAACGTSIPVAEIFARALAADPQSAFGGIVAINSRVDVATAMQLSSIFLECIAAPEFSSEALQLLAEKKNLRVVQVPWLNTPRRGKQLSYRSIRGALLVQQSSPAVAAKPSWHCVTCVQPTAAQMDDLCFALRVAAQAKSNASVIARDLTTLGIGSGQTSRIDSVQIAARKAEAFGKQLAGSVLATDGFFPFDDCVRFAADQGVKAIIQPGGSKRDGDSIAACDRLGIAMVLTGERFFLH